MVFKNAIATALANPYQASGPYLVYFFVQCVARMGIFVAHFAWSNNARAALGSFTNLGLLGIRAPRPFCLLQPLA